MPAELQVSFDPLLEGNHPQLLESFDRCSSPGLVGEIGQGWASPQGERFPEPVGATFGDELLETVQVELAGAGPNDVAGPLRQHSLAPESLPDPGHSDLERLARRLGRLLAPELVDQAVGGDDLIGVQEQVSENRLLPRPAEGDGVSSLEHLERPEDPELHLCEPNRPVADP